MRDHGGPSSMSSTHPQAANAAHHPLPPAKLVAGEWLSSDLRNGYRRTADLLLAGLMLGVPLFPAS
jgi:hypothetical protein